jgi:hypothetical protein
MAPLPANSTPRFRVHYSNAGEGHVMDIRSHDSPLALGLNVDDLLTALSPLLLLTTVETVEFAASGSNVFNLVTSGIETNTYGSGAGGVQSPSNYINFIGRSSDGRRVRLAVFGVNNVAQDYRWNPGDNSNVDAAIAALNVAANHFVTIGDIKPVWKSYANAGFNAYWQKAIRP